MLVRLRELIKNEELPSHQDIVREAAGVHLREEIAPATVREWCQTGIIHFIIDGFDEIPPDRRDLVLTWIKDLSGVIEQAGLVLTSRPLSTPHLENLPRQWNSWQLLAFDKPRVIDYISRWYAHAPLLAGKTQAIDANGLAERWLGDVVLQPLVGIPLMLATLLMVHHMDGELPRGRSKLYERYIDGMLGLWDSRREVESTIKLTLAEKKRILTRLALKLHMAETEQLGDVEMQHFMSPILQDLSCTHSVLRVLDHLRERSGLLVGPGTWGFVHKSIGEFLVAVAICDGDQTDPNGQKLDRLRLFRERHNDRWNTVLFFWAGLTSPGDLQSFIEQITEQPSDDDFLLAVGLFYDQLQPHRLAEPWRSEQLINLFKKGISNSSSPMSLVCYMQPKNMKFELKVPSERIKGLGQQTDLYNALWECLDNSAVTCRQALDCHKSLFPSIFSFYSAKPKNADDLQAVLLNTSWPHTLPSNWMLYSLNWGTLYALKESSSVLLSEYVEIFRKAMPELEGMAILYLFASLLLKCDFKKNGISAPTQEKLESIIKTIHNLKNTKIDRQLLALSKEFFCGYFTTEKNPFDLLESFLIGLDKATEEQWLQDDNLVAETREYVVELKRQRDAVHQPT